MFGLDQSELVNSNGWLAHYNKATVCARGTCTLYMLLNQNRIQCPYYILISYSILAHIQAPFSPIQIGIQHSIIAYCAISLGIKAGLLLISLNGLLRLLSLEVLTCFTSRDRDKHYLFCYKTLDGVTLILSL